MKRAWPRLAACVCAVSAGAAFADEPVEFDRPGTGFSASVLAPGSVVWEQGLPDSERDAGDGGSPIGRAVRGARRSGGNPAD